MTLAGTATQIGSTLTIINPLDHTTTDHKGTTITTNKITAAQLRTHHGYPEQEQERSYTAISAALLPILAAILAIIGHFTAAPVLFVLAVLVGLTSVTFAVLSLRELL